VDISSGVLLDKARKINPEGVFVCSSTYELCFKDKTFDMVLLSEVLEHLSEPENGIEEAKRVSQGYVLVTVPNEPYWRIANMLRLSYLRDFGNTPGHVQHYTKKKFGEILRRHFSRVRMMCSTIWIIALCDV
jgi:ubiquinone/menaquinone biosynthesis C-methylase UbiE